MVKFIKIAEDVQIPKGVDFKLSGKVATAKGKMGIVVKDFAHAKKVDIKIENQKVIVSAEYPRKQTIGLLGTVKNTIQNMFLGVTEGYTYKMKIIYSHFPITVEVKKGSNQIIIKNFIGERAPRMTKSVGTSKVEATKEEVIITGPDKEHVGQTCANIQKRCKIKEKDLRVFQDGIFVYEKMQGNKSLWAIK